MSETIKYPGPDFLHKQKLSPEEWEKINESARKLKRLESKKLRNIVVEGHDEEWKDQKKYPDFTVQIQNYLDRLSGIINPSKLKEGSRFDRRERNISLLKPALYKEFVIKPKDVPESYFDSIKKRHRQEGYGDIEISEEERKNETQTIIDDQKQSLDSWIDYLASDDAKYPEWLKYYAFRNIVTMGRYDKSERKFTKREGKGTVSPFPELNREALAIVLNDLEKQSKNKAIEFGYDIDQQTKQRYLKLLKKKKFPELYAFAIERFKPISKELLKNTTGEWIKYPQGSNSSELVKSLSNYGTGWCIRGEATASRYLENNNLYVFYSNDKDNKASVPRVVIVEDASGNIKEVRGVEKEENLDPHIGDVVENKLKEFGSAAEKYKKKSADMKYLTEIEEKVNNRQELTTEDLTFLYEIDNTIEGFGYSTDGRCSDPRIKEIREQRNPEEDMLIIFDCTKEQIAKNPDEINENTKAYVGSFKLEIFDLIQQYNIEHIYTSFPEGKIPKEHFNIGGTPKPILIKEILDQYQTSNYSRDMMDSDEFTVLENPKPIDIVKLKVRDLFGDEESHTTAEIMGTINDKDENGNPAPFTGGIMTKLGLELCPAETGPHLCMKYQGVFHREQPMNEWFSIAMKPIADRNGNPYVFDLYDYWDGLCLDNDWARPDDEWSPDDEIVFGLRKLKT